MAKTGSFVEFSDLRNPDLHVTCFTHEDVTSRCEIAVHEPDYEMTVRIDKAQAREIARVLLEWAGDEVE